MQHEAFMTRRYLAVFLPLLPAERLIRHRGNAPDRPFALVEKDRGAIRLIACDAQALGLGLMPGTALADARARVPDLAVFDHDAGADMALLGWIADGCERYTPACMLDPPQGLLLDISGCEHLFGDEARLAKDLQARDEIFDRKADAGTMNTRLAAALAELEQANKTIEDLRGRLAAEGAADMESFALGLGRWK